MACLSATGVRYHLRLFMNGYTIAYFFASSPATNAGTLPVLAYIEGRVTEKYVLDGMIYFPKTVRYNLDTASCISSTVFAKLAQVAIAFVAGEDAKKFDAIVYPFIKSRKWYRTPVAERQAMMDEHIAVGNKYPEVILNTTYSFGIHDEDFMLAFETDELIKFQDLIIELRTTRVSDYITSDTPMIVCVKKDIVPMIQSLG